MLAKKHNAINYHVIREAVAAKILRVGKEDGMTNLADLFTKVLTADRRRALCRHYVLSASYALGYRSFAWAKPVSTSWNGHDPLAFHLPGCRGRTGGINHLFTHHNLRGPFKFGRYGTETDSTVVMGRTPPSFPLLSLYPTS